MKTSFLLLAFIFTGFCSFAQILTSSPYSRYGLGEINLPTFATPAAMGGSFIAFHQDTTGPFFINTANPAGLSGLKLTTLELGGQAQFTKISSSTTSANKRNLNFSYGSIGFPLKRFGGAAFGIMPYSTVGYKITSTQTVPNVTDGDVTYVFEGEGGINKAFIGAGVKPFRKQLSQFYASDLRDTLVKYHDLKKFKRIKFQKQLLSELSVGATANYLFGTINQNTNVVYPGSITYYNTRRERSVQVSDLTFNAGLQTHFSIDSVNYRGKDTLRMGHKRMLKERILIGAGFFINTPGSINAKQNNIIYNYSLDGLGNQTQKDTLLNSQNQKGNIRLPLEMGIGFSIKKGQKLTVLIDAATTNWGGFKYFETPTTEFKNSYRVSAGLNYIPNKMTYGPSTYLNRVQYRIGASYSNGYLDLKNTSISNYAVTAGLGLPVGLNQQTDMAMVNLSIQYGTLGSLNNKLLQEKYFRVIVGFTFNKLWFQKYKYD